MTDPPGVAPPPTAAPLEPPLEPPPLEPPPREPSPPPPIPAVPVRRALGVAFELLQRSSADMRRASFYIGAVALGTLGPVALVAFAAGVVGLERSPVELGLLLSGPLGAMLVVLTALAVVGGLVVGIESRNMAVAILGGRMAELPIDHRRALARSRMVFWRAVAVGIVAAIPSFVAQALVDAVIVPGPEIGLVLSTVVGVLLSAPFAYVLCGVILGDVDAIESIRRSARVVRARPAAAIVVVTFEVVAVLLIALGVLAGSDIVLRVLGALGIGLDSGPVGLAILVGVVVVGVFAFGTLTFTVLGLAVAPQVVMFLALTGATHGLAHVLPGGQADRERLPTYPRPMLAGFVIGAIGLAIAVQALIA